MGLPRFMRIFKTAKRDVADMRIHAVEIVDQKTQAVFELYAAIALKTPYNDFRTH
jgi:hypothetical protein